MEKGPLLGAGRTADVFAWGEDRILKLFQKWMPDVAVEREYSITRLAQAAGLPVPEAHELIRLDGRTGIVFERIQGKSLLNILELQPWKIVSISHLLAEYHARLHNCSLPPDAPSQREQIERGIGLAEDLSEAEKQTVLADLASLPEGNVVCHGDFHPDNILMSGRGPVIIDWMTGRRGHPLADVARTELIMRTGGLPHGLPFITRLVINQSRGWLVSVYKKRYLQLHPALPEEIEPWRLSLMAARLFEVETFPEERRLLLTLIRKTLAKMRPGQVAV